MSSAAGKNSGSAVIRSGMGGELRPVIEPLGLLFLKHSRDYEPRGSQPRARLPLQVALEACVCMCEFESISVCVCVCVCIGRRVTVTVRCPWNLASFSQRTGQTPTAKTYSTQIAHHGTFEKLWMSQSLLSEILGSPHPPPQQRGLGFLRSWLPEQAGIKDCTAALGTYWVKAKTSTCSAWPLSFSC